MYHLKARTARMTEYIYTYIYIRMYIYATHHIQAFFGRKLKICSGSCCIIYLVRSEIIFMIFQMKRKELCIHMASVIIVNLVIVNIMTEYSNAGVASLSSVGSYRETKIYT